MRRNGGYGGQNKAPVERILTLLREGKYVEDVAAKCDVSTRTVYKWAQKAGVPVMGRRGYKHVNHVQSRPKGRAPKVIIPFADPIPPSRAMLALAEFDPVIARAVRKRLGESSHD